MSQPPGPIGRSLLSLVRANARAKSARFIMFEEVHMSKASAVIIGCRKTGLAVIRGLADAGVPVAGLCYGKDQIGSYSRYLTESIRGISPRASGAPTRMSTSPDLSTSCG